MDEIDISRSPDQVSTGPIGHVVDDARPIDSPSDSTRVVDDIETRREEMHRDTPVQTQDTNNSDDFITLARKHYPLAFNWIAVILHSAAATFPFMPIFTKNFNRKVKDTAIKFSKWIVPINMIHNAIEAFMGKRLFEGLARLSIPASLPWLPFYNFKVPYGIFSGINFPNEEVTKLVGDLDPKASFGDNNRKIIEGIKLMWHKLQDDSTPRNQRLRYGATFFAMASMLFGATNGLLFASQSLNSAAARIFGFFRSLGGLVGDTILVLTGQRREKQIGTLFAIASVMDMAQRWINNPVANEIFNHAKTSLDTISFMLWTHFSTHRNTATTEAKTAQSYRETTKKSKSTAMAA